MTLCESLFSFIYRSRLLLVQTMETNKEGEVKLTTLASVPIAIDGEYGNSFSLAGAVYGGKVSLLAPTQVGPRTCMAEQWD